MGRNPQAIRADAGRIHPVAVLIVAVLVLLVSVIAYDGLQQHRLSDARAAVAAWSGRLGAQKGQDGRLIRRETDSALPTKDPWGNALRVIYTQNAFQETVTVISCGPDGAYVTADDISSSVSNTDWVRLGHETADTVEDVTSSLARGVTHGAVAGAVRGVTEALPDPVKKRLGIEETPKPAEQKK